MDSHSDNKKRLIDLGLDAVKSSLPALVIVCVASFAFSYFLSSSGFYYSVAFSLGVTLSTIFIISQILSGFTDLLNILNDDKNKVEIEETGDPSGEVAKPISRHPILSLVKPMRFVILIGILIATPIALSKFARDDKEEKFLSEYRKYSMQTMDYNGLKDEFHYLLRLHSSAKEIYNLIKSKENLIKTNKLPKPLKTDFAEIYSASYRAITEPYNTLDKKDVKDDYNIELDDKHIERMNFLKCRYFDQAYKNYKLLLRICENDGHDHLAKSLCNKSIYRIEPPYSTQNRLDIENKKHQKKWSCWSSSAKENTDQ